MAAMSASIGGDACGIRPKVLMISRPQAPRPMTPTLIFTAGALLSAEGSALVWPNSSTPPSMVISVATEPPLRKSRRLYPSASFSFSFIQINSFTSSPVFLTSDFGLRTLDFGLFDRRLLRLGIHLLQAQRPLNPAQNMLLVSLGRFL